MTYLKSSYKPPRVEGVGEGGYFPAAGKRRNTRHFLGRERSGYETTVCDDRYPNVAVGFARYLRSSSHVVCTAYEYWYW